MTIRTDASVKANGVVIFPEGHFMISVSKTFSQAETEYSDVEREASANVFVMGDGTFESVFTWQETQARYRSPSSGFHICSRQKLPEIVSARITV